MPDSTHPPITMSAVVRVNGIASDSQDESLPGAYLHQVEIMSLGAGLPNVLEAASRAAIESRVLDCFHDHQGIECLDDFEITVEIEGLQQLIPSAELSAATDLASAAVSPDAIKVTHLGKSAAVETTPQVSQVFEVHGAGYEQRPQDDLVFWVSAADEAAVKRAIADTGASFHGVVADARPSDADYELPAHEITFGQALLEAASDHRNFDRPVAGG